MQRRDFLSRAAKGISAALLARGAAQTSPLDRQPLGRKYTAQDEVVILGQGAMRDRPSEALHYSLGSDALHAFTIGAESRSEQDDLVRRIAAA